MAEWKKIKGTDLSISNDCQISDGHPIWVDPSTGVLMTKIGMETVSVPLLALQAFASGGGNPPSVIWTDGNRGNNQLFSNVQWGLEGPRPWDFHEPRVRGCITYNTMVVIGGMDDSVPGIARRTETTEGEVEYVLGGHADMERSKAAGFMVHGTVSMRLVGSVFPARKLSEMERWDVKEAKASDRALARDRKAAAKKAREVIAAVKKESAEKKAAVKKKSAEKKAAMVSRIRADVVAVKEAVLKAEAAKKQVVRELAEEFGVSESVIWGHARID